MADPRRPGETQERARCDRELFDRIARDYCRKDQLAAHRRARELRLLQTMRHAELDPTGDLLEIGCGAGFAADYLRGRYRSYHGVDHSSKLVELADAVNVGPGITFETADATTLTSDRLYNVILMIGVLHHLPEPAATLRHLTGLLKPDGRIVVNEPQNGNPLIQLARRIRKGTDPHYSEDQSVYSGNSLRAVFSDAGCELVKLVPQGLLSTPFAEVAMPAQPIVTPLSSIACDLDRMMERSIPRLLRHLSWNLIAVAEPADRPQR